MRESFEMTSVLHAYRDFAECVVDAITWSDHGSTVAVTFDYPWKPDGSIRGDGEERLYVTLTFKHVQEFDMQNSLRVLQVTDPSCVDWAQNEVALVTIRQDERSRAYIGYSTPFHHAMLRKEGEPYIDVVFAELEISERRAPPRSDAFSE